MKRLAVVAAVLLAVALTGCVSTGRGGGPLVSFSFLRANNPGLTADAVGVVVDRGDPRPVEVVVPPGTDRRRLVATLTLGTEATITVISSGNRVIQENSFTPNDFSVPVIYALELPKQKKPLQYRVSVREADTNPLLAEISFPDGYVLQPAFNPSVTSYSVEVPFATQSVRIQVRGQSPRLAGVSLDGKPIRGASGAEAVDFASGQQRTVTLTTQAEDGEGRAQYTLAIRRGQPDRNALLASLQLPVSPLNPAFAPGLLTYRGVVPFETTRFALVATPQSKFAKVALLSATRTPLAHQGDPAAKDGAQVDFPAGDRLTVIVAVTAQDGSTRDYILELSRAAPDSNNRLAALSVEGLTLSPAFYERQLAYRGTVPFAATQVRLKALTQSKVAVLTLAPGAMAPRTADGKLQYTGNPAVEGALIPFTGTDQLEVAVGVTAQDGSQLRYTLDLRRGPPDSNADLKSLAVSAGILSPAFTPKLISYTVSLPGTVESLNITAAAASAVALVSVPERPELKPAASLVIPVTVASGSALSLNVLVSAEDGTQRLYVIQVSRGVAPAVVPPAGGTSAVPPTVQPAPVTPSPAPAAAGTLVVTARQLRLQAREAAAIRGQTVTGMGRLTVRYHRSADVLLQASVPVQVQQDGTTWALSLEHRSPLPVDRQRLLEIELTIPTSGGGVLYYVGAASFDGQLTFEVPFLLYGSQARVGWPAQGATVSVTGFVSHLPPGQVRGERAADREDFQKNAKGEYPIVVELADAASGRLLARETVWYAPTLPAQHLFAFSKAVQVTEGATVRYTLTATARNGRVWRASGTAQVWTTTPQYAGGFQPVTLALADELTPQ